MTPRALAELLLVCAALAGCGGGAPAARDLGDAPDAGGGDGGPTFQATVDFEFRNELHWTDTTGKGPIERADLSGNLGTVVFRGETLPAVVYREIPFAPYDLAAIVATSEANLRVLYAYCLNGGVPAWYYEALDEPTTFQPSGTVGTCAFAHSPVAADVALLPFAGPPAGLLFADQATVTGAHLQLDKGLGSADFADGTWQVNAFDWVDCALCGGSGWYELHSLLRRGPAVAFGIFYLLPAQPQMVLFSYSFRFDTPSIEPPMTNFDATWVVH